MSLTVLTIVCFLAAVLMVLALIVGKLSLIRVGDRKRGLAVLLTVRDPAAMPTR